jgi:hypothetical protein
MSGQEQEETKQGKAVRERTFKVRLSESEYQLLDANNPYGSIAKLLRQAAVEKATKFIIPKQKMTKKLKQQRLLNLHIARQSEH